MQGSILPLGRTNSPPQLWRAPPGWFHNMISFENSRLSTLISGELEFLPRRSVHRHGRNCPIHQEADGCRTDCLVRLCHLLHVALQWRAWHPTVSHSKLVFTLYIKFIHTCYDYNIRYILCNLFHSIRLVRPVACEQLIHDNYNPAKNPTRTW